MVGAQPGIKILEETGMKIPCDAALIGNAAMAAPDRIEFLRSLNKTANESST